MKVTSYMWGKQNKSDQAIEASDLAKMIWLQP